MTVQHVFSVEKDEAKRSFLVAAHCPRGEPVQFHVYSDVKCFVDGHAYCYACEREHPVKHTLDMLISGPSCKNVSKENANRKDFVECYSDGSGSGLVKHINMASKKPSNKTTPTE